MMRVAAHVEQGIVKKHTCKPPRAVVRWLRRVRWHSLWRCGCGQQWRWQVTPATFRSLGFPTYTWAEV